MYDDFYSNNSALYGGGISVGQDVELYVNRATFSGNMAVHGGGLECFLCSAFVLTG
jgi:predicted outer membrane repeat protein